MTAARLWLGLASTLHGVIIAWAAHTLPWRPGAPLGLVLWALALAHAASAVAALAGLRSWRRVWRVQALASLAAGLVLLGSIALGAERLVTLFGRLGWNFTAILAVIAVLVLGLTLPIGLWGLAATRRHVEEEASALHAPADLRRLWAYLIGGGALVAVLWPLFSGRDSFPLSNYPMFSRPRGQPVLFSVVASSSDGSEWALPSSLVGSDEVLQTKVLIQRAVNGGEASMARLCDDVAARLDGRALSAGRGPSGASGSPEFVDIVSRRYDPVRYFVSGPAPLEERRLHRCTIAERASQDDRALGQAR